MCIVRAAVKKTLLTPPPSRDQPIASERMLPTAHSTQEGRERNWRRFLPMEVRSASPVKRKQLAAKKGRYYFQSAACLLDLCCSLLLRQLQTTGEIVETANVKLLILINK